MTTKTVVMTMIICLAQYVLRTLGRAERCLVEERHPGFVRRRKLATVS